MNQWIKHAITQINADANRSADTHLFKLNIHAFDGIDIYLKDESTHPTGSLKHRLARSLFLYALCNGDITEKTTVIEASSGSTAVSEAYFARMIGVPFIAVIPKSTSSQKIEAIRHFGGDCHLVETAMDMRPEAKALAKQLNGFFMDQFTFAERATDWRGNNNIAESIFRQMALEPSPVPHTVVMSAGTGGTSATIGRFIRYKGLDTRLVVVDPENSVFYDAYQGAEITPPAQGSRIEGIGRPRVEPSFMPKIIDEMIKVPDGASIATILWLEKIINRKAGGSTGTNLWGALQVAQQMQARGEQGSIVTMMCDGGERYLDTYYNPEWVQAHIGDIQPYLRQLAPIQ